MGILGIYLSSLGAPATAAADLSTEGQWRPVLKCDVNNGVATATVENMSYTDSNRMTAAHVVTTGRVVIQNDQIIQYFNITGTGRIIYNMKNGQPGWDQTFAETVENQWFGYGGSENGSAPMRSFHVVNGYIADPSKGYALTVTYTGTGLKVVVQADSQHQANWYFQDCIEQ